MYFLKLLERLFNISKNCADYFQNNFIDIDISFINAIFKNMLKHSGFFFKFIDTVHIRKIWQSVLSMLLNAVSMILTK